MGGNEKKNKKQKNKTKQNRKKNQIQNQNAKFPLFSGSIRDNYQLSGGGDGDDSGDRIQFSMNCNNKATTSP